MMELVNRYKDLFTRQKPLPPGSIPSRLRRIQSIHTAYICALKKMARAFW